MKEVWIKSGFMGNWSRYKAEIEETDKVTKINLQVFLGDLKEGNDKDE